MSAIRLPRAARIATLVVALTATTLGAVPASASPHPDPERDSGQIVGVVTDPDGVPVAEICVDAWSDEAWGGSAWTDEHGTFAIEGVPAGRFIVGFADCAVERRFPNEYHPDAIRPDDATPVAVGEGESVRVVAQLDRGAAITGTVTDDLGDPAPWVCVSAGRSDGLTGGWTSTRADGTYELRGLRAGAHTLSFSSCDLPIAVPEPVPVEPARAGSTSASPVPPEPHGWPYGYLGEWWQDAGSPEQATPIVAIEDATIDGIDASVRRASGIELEVFDPDGNPASMLCAGAYSLDGDWLAGAYGDGSLRIRGLEPGAVAVLVEDCGEGRYEPQWYEDASSLAAATPIEVPALDAASITMQLRPAPLPDLAIRDLQVRPVRIRTDAGSLPGPGTQRDVRLTVVNDGALDAEQVGVVVDAATTSDGARRILLVDVLRLPAGASRTFEVRANLTGMVGDVEVRAATCTWRERSEHDNTARAATYAIAGGLGVGITPADAVPRATAGDPASDCASLLWWDGGEPGPKPVPDR